MNKYIKKNKFYLLGTIICILVSTIFAVLTQFIKGDVLDFAISKNGTTTLKYSILLFIFIMLEIIFHFCYDKFRAKFTVLCIKQLKVDILNSLLNLNYTEYKSHNQGDYISKYTNDVNLISDLHFSTLTILVQILIKILFVSIALFILNWRIALITLLLLTTPLYLPKIIEGRLQKSQTEYVKSLEKTLSLITDWLSAFEIIKNFSIEQKIMEKFNSANNDTMNNLLKNKQLGYLTILISTLISYLSYFIILIFAAHLVLNGSFSAGNFFVAIGMIDQLSYPLITLSDLIQNLIRIKPICREIKEFIDYPNHIDANISNSISCFNREIRFNNIYFSYNENNPLLKNFNLTIQKGKCYLIKGASGCGKTTITNLLLKYYTCDAGNIYIDDSNLDNFSHLYNLITVVRQDAILFNDTLRNNLTMYKSIEDSILISILKQLQLDKFSSKEALDMTISESGSNLSGGERKRICLGRALLRNTEVLVLDEPLANLDSTTGKIVEDMLLNIKDRTVIIVSHQFSEENLGRLDNIIEMI